MGIQVSDWVENIVGKEEIAHYEQFLRFQRAISSFVIALIFKVVFCYCVKMSIYGVKD